MFRPALGARLNLETLDAREMPAILFNPDTGVLSLQGTSQHDGALVSANTNVFGVPTIDVFFFTQDEVGQIVSRESRWFYADDVWAINFSGGNGNDRLFAPEFRVIADGGRGNDRIEAFGRLSGGVGDDLIIVTPTSSRNVIDGGADNDTIVGSINADTIRGGAGHDTISGGGGADSIFGDADNDTIRAGAGNDLVYGGLGNDAIFGEGGNDFLHGEGGGDILDGGAGNDTLFGDGFFVQPTDGNDRLMGGVGRDQLYAGGGNDYLDGGVDLVDDTIHTGPGFDRYALYNIGYLDNMGRLVLVLTQDRILDADRFDNAIFQPMRVVPLG